MVAPYYQDDWCTIYHGDCRAIAPSVAAGAVFMDPPYNVGLGKANRTRHSKRQAGYEDSDDAMDPEAYKALVRDVYAIADGSPLLLVTPGNSNQLLWPRPTWTMAWTKSNGCARTPLTRGKRISLACWEPVLVFGKPERPPVHDSINIPISVQPEAEGHPCPKPLRLMTRLLAMMEPGCVWLDYFMGSGTTLRAAKGMGQHAVGIERVERYCEIAAKRLAQEMLF